MLDIDSQHGLEKVRKEMWCFPFIRDNSSNQFFGYENETILHTLKYLFGLVLEVAKWLSWPLLETGWVGWVGKKT